MSPHAQTGDGPVIATPNRQVMPAIPLIFNKGKPKPKPKVDSPNRALRSVSQCAMTNENDTDRNSKLSSTVDPQGDRSQPKDNGECAYRDTKSRHRGGDETDIYKQSNESPVITPQSELYDNSRNEDDAYKSGLSSYMSSRGEARNGECSVPDRAFAALAAPEGLPTSENEVSSENARHEQSHLLPIFVPSAGYTTPHSATSSINFQFQPPTISAHGPILHPGASVLAFGKLSSHTSSPIPPPSVGSGFNTPPPPARAMDLSPSNALPSRDRLEAEPCASGPYMPYSTHPLILGGPAGGYEEGFPMPKPYLTTSEPRLRSQPAPSVPQNAFSPYPSLSQPVWSPSHNAYLITGTAWEEIEGLRDHLHGLFVDPHLSDCHIYVKDVNGVGEIFEGHRTLLSRSPKLRSMMEAFRNQYPDGRKLNLNIQLEKPHLTTSSFMDAIRYIYGGPALPPNLIRLYGTASDHPTGNQSLMEHTLQRVAIGAWLKLQIFASRNLEFAILQLQWESVSSVLGFATQGGLSHIWKINDGNEVQSHDKHNEFTLPTYDPFSTILLQRTIDFVVHTLPPDFYLDKSAPEMASCKRLPSQAVGEKKKMTRSDPRLSQICFGDLPAEDVQRPSATITTISSLLLSLPFALLKHVLEHHDLAGRLGADAVASIMRQVITEREMRRTEALAAHVPTEQNNNVNGSLTKNLHWEEKVEPCTHHCVGLRLVRRYNGISTSSSSNHTSERIH